MVQGIRAKRINGKSLQEAIFSWRFRTRDTDKDSEILWFQDGAADAVGKIVK